MSQAIMKENIRLAQNKIDETKTKVKIARMRQHYHFMAEQGWINDPNGLIFYKGKYHFFYQYNPYDVYWGAMHWGHAVSEDMLHWEYLPIALAPSEPYDNHSKGGCFSGSAIEYQGRLYLFYTGTTNYGDGFVQSQCMAYSEDGISFTKYEGNPIIVKPPKGYEKDNFRDPKVWKHGDMFYLVCGGKEDNLAKALLYRSTDLLHWEFFNVLAESRGELGYMWECPDFYQIGDKHVLMFSPMGLHERTTVYLVGDMNYDTGKFTYNTTGEIDWGFDYYAPQSFVDQQGRRIIVGWANAWDWMPWWKDWGPTFKEGWCGAFTLPREVTLCRDNTLQFKPIKELESLRINPLIVENIVAENEYLQLPNTDTTSYELQMEIDLENTTAAIFHLKVRSNGDKCAVITVDLDKQMMFFNRSHADEWSQGKTKSPLLLQNKKTMEIHVYVDQSSIEVYTDDYHTSHSCNVFGAEDQTRNFISVERGTLRINKLKLWEIKNAMEDTSRKEGEYNN